MPRLVTLFSLLAFAVPMASTFGCGCDAASLIQGSTDGGTVVFNAVPVGQSEVLEIPIQGSETTETFTSGSVMGSSVFQVLTTFPLTVVAGSEVDVRVQFAPAQVGTVSANLVLDTNTMGDSMIPLEGVGAAGDGG